MNKVEALTKKFNQAQAEQDELQRELEEFKKRQVELEAKAEQAAEAGDDEGYLRIKADADKAGALAHVREAKMRRNEIPVTAEEAREAWDEYVKPVEKEIAKDLAEYIKERNALFVKLRAILSKEEKAFWTRQDLMRFSGQYEVPKSGYFTGSYLDRIFPMNGINGADIRNDIDLFRKVGLLSMAEASGMHIMLNGHSV